MSSRGGGHHTDFSSHTLEKLKGMVQDAQPGKVEEIADHWMHVHDQMAGDAPDGSVRDLLEKAVADVREHWHGAAADAFAARAKILSTSLKHGALYAKNTSHTLRSAASALREAKTAVMALQDTVGEEKGGGIFHAIGSKIKDGADWVADCGQRSDEGLNKDVAKGMSTKDALAKHAGSLSRGREIALQAASHMEKLGASYNAKAQDLAGKPHREPWKPIDPPDRIVPPPVVAGSMGTGMASPRKAGSSSASSKTISGASASGGGTSPRPVRTNGAPGEGGSTGPGVHPSAPKAPRSGTSLDGVRGGMPTPVGPPRAGPGGPVAGGAPGDFGSAGEPGVPPGSLPPGGGRGPLGGKLARPGSTVPGTPPGRGRAGSGRSAAPGAPGRTGQGARPPIGGTGGPGASGSGGARGRQGGLTRRPGGVVGEPAKPGAPGKGAQGGSGLHRSRGGGLNSGSAPSSRGRGPMGMPPGGRSGREDRERRGSSRPDYLVEDEETWVPQRDVVPGVIGVPSSEESGDTEAPPVRQERELGPDSSEGSGRA